VYAARVNTVAATATYCPLCGQPNQCAMEIERATGVEQPPCWCTQQTFDADLMARVPEEMRGKTCICPACSRRTESTESVD
jgi:hypothetical protein